MEARTKQHKEILEKSSADISKYCPTTVHEDPTASQSFVPAIGLDFTVHFLQMMLAKLQRGISKLQQNWGVILPFHMW